MIVTMTKTVLDNLTDDDFVPLVDDAFKVRLDGVESQKMKLLEVSRMESGPAHNNRYPFSLLFRGPQSDSPQQGIYSLEHPALGELELFLVPIGPDQSGVLYEAVFT